jgi:hypothetical protein
MPLVVTLLVEAAAPVAVEDAAEPNAVVPGDALDDIVSTFTADVATGDDGPDVDVVFFLTAVVDAVTLAGPAYLVQNPRA